MIKKGHALFWIGVYFALILIYGNAFESYLYSIYFISILYPVVIATAYFFNFYLVPKFLLQGKKSKFILYSIYMFIISAHAEIVLIFLAFIYLANYQVQAMHPSLLDVSKLSVTLYTVVFAHGFFLLYRKFQASKETIDVLEKAKEKLDVGYVVVRADRKNVKVLFEQILYVESLSDYVKIHCTDGKSPIVSKAKISHIENELPDHFLRIHRSYLVNLYFVTFFNSEHVTIAEEKLPISRKYKNQVKQELFNK